MLDWRPNLRRVLENKARLMQSVGYSTLLWVLLAGVQIAVGKWSPVVMAGFIGLAFGMAAAHEMDLRGWSWFLIVWFFGFLAIAFGLCEYAWTSLGRGFGSHVRALSTAAAIGAVYGVAHGLVRAGWRNPGQ